MSGYKNLKYSKKLTSNQIKSYKRSSELNRKKALKKNGSILQILRLKKEFDPKNKTHPKEIPITSQKKFWWICSVCGYNWQTSPEYRYDFYGQKEKGRVRDCKVCANKKNANIRIKKILNTSGSLIKNFPKLCEEWNYELNKISPKDVTPRSSKKVWWNCTKHGPFKMVISTRTKKQPANCAKCSLNYSKAEIRLYSEFLNIFENVVWNKKILGKEIDVYLKDYQIGFEIDGYYHLDSKKKDQIKNDYFQSKNIRIIRLRDKKINFKISNYDLFIDSSLICLDDIKSCLKLVKKFKEIKSSENSKILNYLKVKNFINDKKYLRLISNFPFISKELSFLYLEPNIAKDWDYNKNFPLTPDIFSRSSNTQVWWKCNQKYKNLYEFINLYPKLGKFTHNHPSYKLSISDKIRSDSGCRFCGRIKSLTSRTHSSVIKNGSILNHKFLKEIKDNTLRKKIIKFANLLPTTSKLKIEWFCKKHQHSWKQTFYERFKMGRGCRFCGYEKRIYN